MPHHNFFQHHIPSTLIAPPHQTTPGSHFTKSKSYNPYKHHSHNSNGGASTIVVNQPVRSYHFGHPNSFVKPGPSSGPIKSHTLHTPNNDSQRVGVVQHGIRLVGLAPPSAPHLPRS